MKKIFMWAVMLSLVAIVIVACDHSGREVGYLRLTLSEDYDYPNIRQLNVPDTNDFILTVTDSDGANVYNGKYGDRPSEIEVPAGTYTIFICSEEFSEPAFDKPVYGCESIVMVSSGESVGVKLYCFQINSGIKLIFDKSFKERFYGYDIYLEQRDFSLQYPFNETRWGYFYPEQVKLYAEKEQSRSLILSRNLSMSEMLALKLYASEPVGDGFSVVVDTSRVWLSEEYLYGSGNDGSSVNKAIRQDELIAYLGAENIWVEGYIVGGDVTNTSVNFDPPFAKQSNFAISTFSEASTREQCSAVELTTTGGIRATLNLVEHPEHLGKKIILKGNIENYFGSPGIKGVKEYYIEK